MARQWRIKHRIRVGLCLYSQLVNLIFLLGQAVEYNWGMWLQICLVLSALLSHYVRPYELTSDNRQEQMSFLGLSLVLTVTNSGVRYAGAWKWYHISVVGSWCLSFWYQLLRWYVCLSQLLSHQRLVTLA